MEVGTESVEGVMPSTPGMYDSNRSHDLLRYGVIMLLPGTSTCSCCSDCPGSFEPRDAVEHRSGTDVWTADLQISEPLEGVPVDT
jgi:hypothetical protein